MKLKVGSRVYLKPSYAKWHLDHPEIYERPSGEVDQFYETETLLHLMCCMGVPLQSEIHATYPHTPRTYLVAFQVGRLKMSYWVERSHIIAK